MEHRATIVERLRALLDRFELLDQSHFFVALKTGQRRQTLVLNTDVRTRDRERDTYVDLIEHLLVLLVRGVDLILGVLVDLLQRGESMIEMGQGVRAELIDLFELVFAIGADLFELILVHVVRARRMRQKTLFTQRKCAGRARVFDFVFRVQRTFARGIDGVVVVVGGRGDLRETSHVVLFETFHVLMSLNTFRAEIRRAR